MGLKQKFIFEYKDSKEVVSFIETFSEKYQIQNKHNDFFIIQNSNNSNFTFDFNIEPYGLSSERTGEYYQFLGLFIELLTGKFGTVEIEDI